MPEEGSRWASVLLAAAGGLGAAGVALGAASAHLGGGDLARLAAFFLLLHGAAIPGFLSVPDVHRVLARASATMLAVGAACFSGDVAVLAFTGQSPVSGLAPLGGLLLIAGWLMFAAAAIRAMGRPFGSRR